MGYIADSCRRFFHPAAIDEMLETFLPLMNGTNLNVSLIISNNLKRVLGLIFTICLGLGIFGIVGNGGGILLAHIPAPIASTNVFTDALSHVGSGEFIQL